MQEYNMTKKEQIFEILKYETPTVSELAKRILGRDTYSNRGNIRKQVSNIRYQYGVTVTVGNHGRYSMAHIYTKHDEQFQNRLVQAKLGRPRKVS